MAPNTLGDIMFVCKSMSCHHVSQYGCNNVAFVYIDNPSNSVTM